jgi:ParB family transcriptional regulator, chromosome partitioning protein
MTRKKRLGRTLDSLLSKPVNETPAVTGHDVDTLRNIPVDLLQRGQYQPRDDMRQDTLENLAASIRAQGVVQPIVARRLKGKNGAVQRYEIIAGERRWRAAQMAGLQEIPTVIRDVEDDDAIAMALIENIQREDLNPLEEAKALDRLIREFGLTHQKAADAIGRGRASVSNLLRLLELSDRVKPLLESRQLDMGHARALLAVSNPNQQYDAAKQVVRRGLSVRETEKLVRHMLQVAETKKGKAAQKTVDADIRRLEMDVSEILGAKTSIDHRVNGGGKIVINYNSLDELDGILKHIK